MSIRVIHIPAAVDTSESLRVIEVPTDQVAEHLHELVKGSFQCVELNDGVFVWLNEEGKFQHMPWNRRAQILWDERYGPGTDFLVGPAVLTGGADARGDTLGLTDEQIATIERTLGSIAQVRTTGRHPHRGA